MKIVIGNDHTGYDLKMKIIEHLEKNGYTVVDVGSHDTDSVSYVDYGHLAAEEILTQSAELGIIICGTGIGISIAANKHRGIRAALCTNCYMAETARKHNNANMLALGARVLASPYALTIVDTFLKFGFEGGRHKTRVDSLTDIENL